MLNPNDDLDYDPSTDPLLREKRLDEEKFEALKKIFTSRSSLVTARAGSGKSTLLLSLIHILVNRKKVNKDHILLLSFNKDVREKNAMELHSSFGVKEYDGVQTFNSLGYQIAKPDRTKVLADQDNDKKLVEFLTGLIKKEANLWLKLKYWWYLGELNKETTDDDDSYTTLLGERVKSYGEKLIADFLFENGLDYEYEPVYQSNEYQYRP